MSAASESDPTPTYKRVLLKLSGEALMGEQQFGVDPAVASRIAHDVGAIAGSGGKGTVVEVDVAVGVDVVVVVVVVDVVVGEVGGGGFGATSGAAAIGTAAAMTSRR